MAEIGSRMPMSSNLWQAKAGRVHVKIDHWMMGPFKFECFVSDSMPWQFLIAHIKGQQV